MAHFGIFFECLGWLARGASFSSRFNLPILSITSSNSGEVVGTSSSWVYSWGGVGASKEIPKIDHDPRPGFPLQGLEFHYQIHNMSLDGKTSPDDQVIFQ